MQKGKIFFLVGPTAIGKTEVSIHLAKKLNAEIISSDSMQIYKGTDIITSKPKGYSRRRPRHHLISIIPPTKEYNVAVYRRDALGAIKEIMGRGKAPLFVGGTGLYMSVLVDGIFKVDSSNRFIRQRLYRQAGRLGSSYLYKRLKEVDPQAASKIHPHDLRRIVRALEVFEATGKLISRLQKQRKGLLDEGYEVKIICLNMERGRLYGRIEKRVERMFRQGLFLEVKRLLKLKLSKTVSCAIGIREIKGYLEGLYDLAEAKRLIKQHTRNYAKRQLTWFRKDKRIEWVAIGEGETPASLANSIFKKIRDGSQLKAKVSPLKKRGEDTLRTT